MTSRLTQSGLARFLLLPLIMLALLFTLSGCGDKEPDQRKAFIDFLQTRVLTKPQLAVPALTEDKKKAFGPYINDYAVLTDYHKGVGEVFNAQLEDIFGQLRSVSSVGTLISKRDELKNLAVLSRGWKPTDGTETA